MNFLAHGYRWLDRPYFLAGTALPDWIVLADRTLRIRMSLLRRWCHGGDPVAEVARGMIQHLRDDVIFHSSPVFAWASAKLADQVHEVLQEPPGSLLPAFLGHLLTELLLDAAIARGNYGIVSRYYGVLASIPVEELQGIVETIVGRPAARLTPMIRRFLAAQVVWDYLDDRSCVNRVNQILRRVGFSPICDRLSGVLPAARGLIHRQRERLLAHVLSAHDPPICQEKLKAGVLMRKRGSPRIC